MTCLGQEETDERQQGLDVEAQQQQHVEALVVATPVVAESVASLSSDVEETVATTVAAVEAQPLTLSHSVRDVLRHQRGKVLCVLFLVGLLGTIGGIAFFAWLGNEQGHGIDRSDRPGYRPGRPYYPPVQDSAATSTSSTPTLNPSQTETLAPDDDASLIDWEGELTDDTAPPALATPLPTYVSTLAPTPPLQGQVISLLSQLSSTAFDNPQSPQVKALDWLLKDIQLMNKQAPSNNTAYTTSPLDFNLPYSRERLLQRYALATFYFSTLGVGWRFQKFWLSSAHECEWYSSQEAAFREPEFCDEDGRYIRLVLVDNILRGSLPPQVGLLTHLHTLQLQGDNFFHQPDQLLAGSLPTQLGLLTGLQWLDISKNGLTGPLPTQLGDLTQLQSIKLLENQLTGTISDDVLALPSLQEIRLYDNRLSGTLPTPPNASAVQIIDWGNNQLTGTLPAEWALAAPNLEFLDVQGNQLTGTLPTQLGVFSSLQYLKVNDNLLEGTIPTQLAQLAPTLQWLLLGTNQLSGTIPGILGDLHSVGWFVLEGNSLTGTIPTELGRLYGVRFLRLQENQLVGSVPQEVCNLQDNHWWFFFIEVDCQDPITCSCRFCLCSNEQNGLF